MARDMRLTESSDVELDALSAISASDVERARDRFRSVTVPALRDLADVTEVTGGDDNPPSPLVPGN